ncbi:hypothetical protein FOA52_002708 [Chlamydomonas sp. UWO 241]|nr:hypothetical protein FOA52_002708 [Chlamydomonas sp. UWO 241]
MAPITGSGGYARLPTDDATQRRAANRAARGTRPSDSESYWRRDDSSSSTLPSEIPTASIALAIGLLVFGIASFVLAWLHFTQEILGKAQAEIGFTILGLMTFVPGFHHCRIAYYAWRGVPGFNWDDIPSY